jgi:ACS family sodium-dependent inorganic phosphate cotransporter
MVHYMIRVNMSIAIVEMVATNDSNFTSTHSNTFSWDEHKKNDLLGCFFWGLLLSAIPGGRLSEIYGTRKVLDTAMVLASLLTIVTPFACYLHYYCVLTVRIAMGLALGVSWPSVPPMAVKWVARANSSKFMANAKASSLGAGVILPVCGYIITLLGWPSVFFITGALSLVWCLLWFHFVYDSPRQHPRISKREKQHIENEIGEITSFGSKKTPWLSILSSGPVWAIIVADFCSQFNMNIIINELPSYMDEVLHFNIKENGWFSSLPFFGKFLYLLDSTLLDDFSASYFGAVIFTHVADKWRKSRKYSLITIRKLFTSISFWIPCLLYLIQVFWGYDRIVSILAFIFCQGFNAAGTAGFMSNSMDISPVYSGTIFGIAFACGASTGYISAKVVAFIVNGKGTFEEWRYIFWILIIINLIGSIFYLIFASAELQDFDIKQVNGTDLTRVQSEDLDETRNFNREHDILNKGKSTVEVV